MKIDGAITILVDEGGLRIEVYDRASCKTFLRVRLDSTQFCQAMSRLAHTPCESVEVYHLDKINKDLEHKSFDFELISDDYEVTYHNKKDVARNLVKRLCPQGWEPDLAFGSQGSFFQRDGRDFARTTIRRWVDKEKK